MAISLNTLRSQKQTSIHGRRLALDNNDFLLVKGERCPVIERTSASTAQTIDNYGLTVMNVTSACTTGTNAFFLPNPIPGNRIQIAQGVAGTTSTQGSTAIAVQRSTTNFYIDSSEGTTMVAVLLAFGTLCELTGMTTDRYKVTARAGTHGLTGTS